MSGPANRPPTPLYLAFERVAYKRNMRTMDRYKVLHEAPGPAHALDAASTREGDPWRRFGSGRPLVVRDPMFYDHGGPRAACGRQVLVALPAEYDANDPDACAECAELVHTGQARGRFGEHYSSPDCDEMVSWKEADGRLVRHVCRLRWRHEGAHRDAGGGSWETGPDDFIPPPDGYV